MLTQYERQHLSRTLKAIMVWEIFRETEAYVERRLQSSSARVPLVADPGQRYWRQALVERGYPEHLVDAAVKYATQLIEQHNPARIAGER